MSNLFDTNARADEAVFGGEPAARAVGLPTPRDLPGTFAPGGSNQTAQNLVSSMEADTQRMMAGLNASRPAKEPVQGYNPETNEVFSGGKTFQLDLNEGRQNAQLFDIDNPQLPQGFVPIRSSEFKKKLASEYDDLGLIDATQRRAGQAFSNVGSALQDFGAESLGQYMQESGGALAARNPSKITTAADVIDSPLQTATEAIGEVVGYDVPVAIAQTAAGAAAGAKAGTLLAPFTGGASIPIGALLGGIGARYLGTMLETYGSVRAEQREQGIEDKTRAAGAAGASAALEALLGPEARIASQFGKRAAAADQALSGADRTLAAGRLRGAGRDLLVQGGIEGATEVPQSAIERFGAYKDLGSEEAIDEYAVGAAKGFFGGAALGPVTSTMEYQQAKNFVDNLKADMALASDPTASGPDRLRAAKRAQDVLRGSSDDPQFDAVLQEFRQKLDFVGTQITSNATRTALAEGAPVNLLDTASGEETDRSFGRFNTQPDLFNRVASAEGSEIEIARRQQDNLDVYNQLQADREVPITQIQPGQQEMFGETGAPTYAADPGFGESQFEFNQNVQGPPITPGQRTVAGFPDLNATMDQIQSGTVPDNVGTDMLPQRRAPRPVTGELTPGQQAALTAPAPFGANLPPSLRNVSLDLGAPAATQAPAVTEAAPAAPLQQVETRPVPVVSEVPGSDVPGVSPAAAPAVAGLSAGAATDLESLIEAENNKVGERNPLEASVEGTKSVRAPGKVSLTAPQIARITSAMTDPEARSKRLPAKERQIVDALVKFAQTYKTYLDAGGNLLRSQQVIKRGKTAAEAVDSRTKRAEKLGYDVRDALAELGVAVGGNAKDVDALVATIKAASQGKINTVADPTMRSAFKRLDAMLSQAWTAAKDETFTDELVDMLYTRQGETRAAREAKDQTPPLVKAAQGERNPQGLGPTYKGFLGVMHYIRFYGTGYERLLARQIREALVNADNVPGVEFITEGNSRYDPVSNKVFMRRDASNSVALHEGLHAALQWFVYNNPNDPAVKQLKASVKAVVGYKGALGEKAKAVQDLLKKLVAGGNELDAVLELVSYGNTLNEFRKALDAMPRKTTPKSFYEAATDVWQSALAVIKKLLGVDNTEATAVIQSTWDLLAQVGEGGKAAPKTRQGNVLEAMVDTATAAFRRWFGDSKVVDKSGKPLVVYTGTSKDVDFGTFKLPKNGAWFTTSPDEASGYALENDSMGHKYNPDTRTYEAVNTASRVIPVYLRIENPYTLTADEQNMMRMAQNYKRAQGIIFERAKARGYDGVDLGGGVWVVIAGANQIKSAISNKGTYSLRSGNILEAAVTSSDPEPASEPTTVAKGTDEQAAKSAGYPSFDAYASQPSSKYNITRMFFERIGFGVDKDGNYNAAGRKTQELASKASLIIRRNFPMLERIILNINSKFGLPPAMQRIMEYFKTNQNTGILEMEKLTEYVHRNPAVARPMLDYLDGDTKALDGVKDATAIRAIADNVRMHLETYINDLPANSPERALFQNLKFTEYLLHPKSVAQLANKSFGLKKLSTLLTIKRREETNIDAFKQMLPMKDGVVDSEAPLYQTFETVKDNDGVNQRVPMGFIDKKLADTNPPAGLDIDTTRVWKMTGRKGDRYSFVSRAVTPGEVRRMAEDGRVEELSATLLNTMAALSHNYASRNFFAGLLPLGREDGEPTAMSVVFDSEEQLRKIFKGGVPNEIIDAGNDAIDMQSIKADLQRTGTWVRLPEGPTYGALAGKIISGPAWSAMRDMHDRAPLLNSQALATTMSWFKKAKTGYTPATHVNNILTNYSMTLLHGISHKTLLDAAKLFAKFEASPGSLKPQELAMVQAFYRSGAVLGQYTQTEAKQTIAKALSASISPDPGGSLLTKINQLAKFEKEFAQLVTQAGRMGRNADARVMELYAAGDNIFRLAAFMNVAGNLQARDGTKELSPAQTTEAGIAARKMFLDYDIDARWVRAARQSVLPFVSWSYAIMPVLGRLAITRPWAMVNMLAAIAIMNSIMDDEDDEEWRKKGPEAVRDKALWGMGPHMYMRVPFLGDDQNPVYWNIGKSIPMMALFQPPAGESKLLGQDWYPGFLNPSGPYVSLLANTFLNVDPFTGKELYKETDTSTDKLLNSGAAVWDVMMPSWASTRLYNNFKDLADGKVGPTGVLPDSMFIARLFGMTLYEFNRSEVQYSQNAEVSKLKREFMTAMRAAAKDEARRGYPDYEALDVKLADLRERMMQAMDKARGEE